MNRPPWLLEEPEIIAMLHKVLDRFDEHPTTDRQRPTWLAATSTLPSLQRMDQNADQLWQFVKELETLRVLSIKRFRGNTLDAEWHAAKLGFNEQGEAILREWLDRPPTLATMIQWRMAVQQHESLFAHGTQPLLDRRIAIPGRRHDEIVHALSKIGSINTPSTLRQLSSFAFWGDSKVLDNREELITALFPDLPLRERAIVVAVHLPSQIEGILFIENQDTYIQSSISHHSQFSSLALIYLSGFKNTAQRIREYDGAHLHFSGALYQSAKFADWWFERNVVLPAYFWGDLDFAAMQMLKVLRQRFDDVHAWPEGYANMVEYVKKVAGRMLARDSQQVDPQLTGCAYADDVLLPAIRQFGFRDQESIESE